MATGKQDSSFSELMKDQIDEIKISNSALDQAIEWIGSNLNPDEVFSVGELETWAEKNGYTKE